MIKIDGNYIEHKARLRPYVGMIKRRDHRKLFLHPPGRNHYYLLAYLASQIGEGLIVELGTHHGTSSLAMSINPKIKVVTYDIEDRYGIKPKPENVETRLGDIFELDQQGILLESQMIFLDTAHEGPFEQKVYDFLKDNNYEGILVLDDIFWAKEMIAFWEGITTTKYDVTAIGHGDGKGPMGNVSGTGIVDFANQMEFVNCDVK
jgi:predicted O-methyltransferase YrrM